MTRQQILAAFATLIAVGVVAAVVYLESANSRSAAPAPATTATSQPASTTSPPTTAAPTTVAPTTSPPTTEPISTTEAPTTLPPPERALVPVVVSSGPSSGERLGPGALLMASVGWTDIRSLTGAAPMVATTVFYVDGMQAAAELLAADTGVPLTSIAPMSEAPPVAGLANTQLLFYFGGN